MRVEDSQARDYYIEETARQGWSSRVLARAIETRSYQRLLEAPEASIPSDQKPNPLHLLKDPYILEFLDLPDRGDFSERQIEDALILRLRDFLMELGKGFSFVSRQFRVTTETTHFYRVVGK
jgi:predicted nuclease of restriction endonuclease-like (RecB) superfamily